MSEILVVDDEDLLTSQLEARLAGMGYEVAGRASSGEEAIDMARRLRPDLILMDIVMPGKFDGIEAAGIIRAEMDIPVIFLTAYADEGIINRAKRVEPLAYLVKPFQDPELRAEIEVALYRREMEQKLRASELRYRTLFESAPMGIAFATIAGNIQECNDLMLQMTGYSEVDLRHVNLRETYQNPEEYAALLKQLQTDGFVRDFEAQLKRKDGTPYYAAMDFTIITLGNEDVLLTITRDITGCKRVEEERERFMQELEAKNTEMERFTYTVSHDLRAPLLTIQGFVSILREDLEQNKKEGVENDLKWIENGATKMERLLDDTLQLSRIGRVANPPEDVPFDEIIKDAQEQTAEQLKSSAVEFIVADAFPTVHVDRMRIAEMLVNLITNSINYMSEQSHPEIEIGVRTEGEETVFFVKDNGMGIAPQEHDKVFDLFYRGNSSSKGTGVGLAIVKRIIEVHKGRIWVESEKGKGCTMCFTLPFR
ncbi:MAG: ATP-binding protein [Halobacteriota archaeon]